MYNQSLLKATVTFKNDKDWGKNISVVDENDTWYSIPKTKKDQTTHPAFAAYSSWAKGIPVVISYSEKPGNKPGQMFRDIVGIFPVDENNPTAPAAPATTAPYVSPNPSNRFNFNVPKDVSITAQAFVKSLLESHQATLADLQNPEWWELNIFPAVKAMNDGYNGGEDISVEEIPF